MNRGEFLQGLENALTGEVPSSVVQENLRFYDDYIRSEIQKSRSEADVMEELGDPRLIAKTIIDTTPGAGEEAFESYASGADESRSGGTYQENGSRPNSGNQNGPGMHYYDFSKWYWKLLAMVIVVVVIVVVISIVGGLLSLVLPMLPVIGLVILVMWFVRGGPHQ